MVVLLYPPLETIRDPIRSSRMIPGVPAFRR
jgi:hypothetical protein